MGYLVPNKNQRFHWGFGLSKVEAPQLLVYLGSLGLPCASVLQWRFLGPCENSLESPSQVLGWCCLYPQQIWDVCRDCTEIHYSYTVGLWHYPALQMGKLRQGKKQPRTSPYLHLPTFLAVLPPKPQNMTGHINPSTTSLGRWTPAPCWEMQSVQRDLTLAHPNTCAFIFSSWEANSSAEEVQTLWGRGWWSPSEIPKWIVQALWGAQSEI